ncbi:ATPase, P-type (transporting), HAD superfamily, subfamily IC [Shewanella halifaxensis HAW-EB4]|uniref:ATPase, P-type (Transporting), HAD superfamily, subfamily IC n=1 Tax=Shewanella halifaxensis (strain HAW-EB4) TaxID=458817 RepID=B0TSV8_SHEHH|nr:HAD-IC family P-type ATPase [Shewanella halifaxensis]ABZ75283.1 ATPase, P-type (transporting), HAD superfamily, subfamily IC [Shewanella halifaxensis HAW-EB4]
MAVATQGLTTVQALARLQQYGKNCLPKPSRNSFLSLFLLQFRSAFIYVLLVAVIVCLLLGQLINAFFISAVLLINALIGTIQEYSAQQAADSLAHMVPQQSRVLRDAHPILIPSEDVVPGDWLILNSGDRIGADIALKQSTQFQVDESALTGESISVSNTKQAFAGTLVTHGRAEGEVIATGSKTQIGQIAKLVHQGEPTKPPLMQRIDQFTLRIAIAILIIIAFIFGLTLLRGAALSEVFLLGVALAVSAIPEGLPAAITVALAIGMKRMAKANVIVRKLVAVEALGSCTFIASDKTGTLTVNEMTIGQIWLANDQLYDVTGEGLSPTGQAYRHGHDSPVDLQHETALKQLVTVGVFANEAHLVFEEDKVHADGDGVDLAFLILGHKLKTLPDTRRKRLTLFPYESEKGFGASVDETEAGPEISVKGAVEKILPMCSMSKEMRQTILSQSHSMAKRGYRVLALAHGTGTPLDDHFNGLKFLGLVAMSDPLRPDAIDAVAACRQAKIKVAMITGDHPATALSLSQQLKIAGETDSAITGQQLEQARLEDINSFDRLVANHRVFARVKPKQKMEITESLIRQGEFVAMTGDGVNDAPALKHAHVGIAMGLRGTDVARESASLVLTDDKFSSIVKGIIEGRIVYNNIRKVIYLLISTGAAEILLFILSVLFALPIPLFPLQILWLNIVTNGVQDVALAFEPAEGRELSQAPRSPKEPIFDRLMLERVCSSALTMGLVAFALFASSLHMGVDEVEARNLTLMLMVLFENVHALNSRSEHRSLLRTPLFSNPILLIGILVAQGIHIGAMYTPGLSDALQLSPISLEQWLVLLATASVLFVVDEAHKKYWHTKHHPKSAVSIAEHPRE